MRVELHTDDTGVEVALLFAVALVLGAVQPARPWLWALVVGGSIPLADALFSARSWLGLLPIGAFTFVVALLGGYGGALLVRMLGGRKPSARSIW